MSSTIRSTIESVISEKVGRVPSGYQSAVDSVIEAVEGLAAQAADSIRQSAAGIASEEQVEAALVSAGLVEPEPIVEEVTPEPASDEDRIGKIEAAVAHLTALAERHLGSRF